MEVKYKNRLEDLKIVVDLGDKYSPGTPFEIEFITDNGPSFVCKHDSFGVFKNCYMISDRHVLCLLDDHNLGIGYLFALFSLSYVDPSMPTGIFNLSTKSRVFYTDRNSGRSFPIYLSNSNSDTIDEYTVNASYTGVGFSVDSDLISESGSTLKEWSDFKDVVKLKSNELIGAKFEFRYLSKPQGKSIVAKYDGNETVVNCRFSVNSNNTIDYSTIIVPIQSSKLFGTGSRYGIVSVEREFFIPDSDFEDGYMHKIVRETLHQDETGEDGSIESTILTNVMRGNSGTSITYESLTNEQKDDIFGRLNDDFDEFVDNISFDFDEDSGCLVVEN